MASNHTQILRERGVRVTAQRLAIMQVVAERPHATADELTDDVRVLIGSISRQAVYDTLGVFVEKNLVRRIQSSGSAAWYEDRVSDNHHHLICRGCNAVVDIDCAVGATPCLTADDDHGFRIDEAEVVYWGLCPSCQSPTTGDDDRQQSEAPPTPSPTQPASPGRVAATPTKEQQ